MIDPVQFRDYIIRPVLHYLEPEIPYTVAAEQLLLMTAAQESKLIYLHQLGKGPAVGLWEMEPHTHDDIWKNYLKEDSPLYVKISMLGNAGSMNNDDAAEMAGNLYYACAMARVFYRRIPEPLPPAGDAFSMAVYYKRHYNTPLGAATVEQAVDAWKLVQRAVSYG